MRPRCGHAIEQRRTSSHITSPGSASHAEFSAQWMLAPKHLRAMLRPASSRDTAVGHLAFACAVRVLESLFLRTSSMPWPRGRAAGREDKRAKK